MPDTTPLPRPPVLHCGMLVLRGWHVDDTSLAQRAASDPDIQRFSSVGVAVSDEAAAQWIAERLSDDRLDWVVMRGDEPLGRVTLAHIDRTDAVGEIGYWTLPEHRRQGVASAAVAEVERLAFLSLGLQRLYIRHEPENQASCAFASSRSYQVEGTQRSAFFRAGSRRDLHVHALIATDPVARAVMAGR